MTATTQEGAAGKFNSREEGLAAIEARRLAEMTGEVTALDGSQVDLTALAQVDTTLDDDDDPDDRAAEAARKKLEESGKLDDDPDKGADKGDGRQKEDKIDDGIIVLSPEELSKYRIRGKVDGQEQEIPLERALPALQKDAAVEKRLKEATEAKREAEQLLAKARNNPGDKQAQEDARQAQQNADDLQKDVEQTVRTALDRFYEGDVDAATQELVKALTGRQQATLDVNKLASEVTQAVKSNLSAESALAQYRKDYPDIANSPHLTQMANSIFDGLVNDQGYSQIDALFEAAKQTRELIRSTASEYGMTEGKAGPTSTRREKIEAKKGDIDPEPRAAGAAKSGLSAPPSEEEARQQAIAEMAEQRNSIREKRGRGS